MQFNLKLTKLPDLISFCPSISPVCPSKIVSLLESTLSTTSLIIEKIEMN